LIGKLLVKDPKKRIKIDQALNHHWFEKLENMSEDADTFQAEYLKRMKSYRAPNRLQHEVLSFLMKNLDTSERVKIKEVFRNITSKTSGDLTFKDLESAFNEASIDGATENLLELKS
jgi:serine/threonine protein kinase